MAVRVVALRICDRCEKAIGQEPVKPDAGGKLPSLSPKCLKVTLSHEAVGEVPATEKTIAEFRDLCDGCDEAVRNILGRLVLEKGAEKPEAPKVEAPKPEGRKGRGKAPAAPATPSAETTAPAPAPGAPAAESGSDASETPEGDNPDEPF